MRIVNVEPRDVHLIIDLSLQEAERILDVIEISTINFTEEPKLKEAISYYKDTFFKQLNELVEGIKSGT
jgi:uncharacterized protein YdhG (YjbR/CyaY superfamily)